MPTSEPHSPTAAASSTTNNTGDYSSNTTTSDEYHSHNSISSSTTYSCVSDSASLSLSLGSNERQPLLPAPTTSATATRRPAHRSSTNPNRARSASSELEGSPHVFQKLSSSFNNFSGRFARNKTHRARRLHFNFSCVNGTSSSQSPSRQVKRMPSRDQKTQDQAIYFLERLGDIQNAQYKKQEYLQHDKQAAAVSNPIMSSGGKAGSNRPAHRCTTSPRLFTYRNSHSGAASSCSSGETSAASANTSAPSSVVSQPVTPLSNSLNGPPDFYSRTRREFSFCDEMNARVLKESAFNQRECDAYNYIVAKREDSAAAASDEPHYSKRPAPQPHLLSPPQETGFGIAMPSSCAAACAGAGAGTPSPYSLPVKSKSATQTEPPRLLGLHGSGTSNASGANANALRSSFRGQQQQPHMLLPNRNAAALMTVSDAAGAAATGAPTKTFVKLCPTSESLHASLRKSSSVDSERSSTGSVGSSHMNDLNASFNSSCCSSNSKSKADEPSQSAAVAAALTCYSSGGAGAAGAEVKRSNNSNSKKSQLAAPLSIPTYETPPPHSIVAEQQGARVPTLTSSDTMAEVGYCYGGVSCTPTQDKPESKFEFEINTFESQTSALSVSSSLTSASSEASMSSACAIGGGLSLSLSSSGATAAPPASPTPSPHCSSPAANFYESVLNYSSTAAEHLYASWTGIAISAAGFVPLPPQPLTPTQTAPSPVSTQSLSQSPPPNASSSRSPRSDHKQQPHHPPLVSRASAGNDEPHVAVAVASGDLQRNVVRCAAARALALSLPVLSVVRSFCQVLALLCFTLLRFASVCFALTSH